MAGHRNAFTLAEVLIALALLGVIAMFLIPKLLGNLLDQERRAVLQETYATLNQLLHTRWMDGGVPRSKFKSTFMDNVNALKLCQTNSLQGECWHGGDSGGNVQIINEAGQPGFILPNGAEVVGFDTCCSDEDTWLDPLPAPGVRFNGISIDWNGAKGPNRIGEDQLHLYVCYGTQPCGSRRAGQFRPFIGSTATPEEEAANQALFQIMTGP